MKKKNKSKDEARPVDRVAAAMSPEDQLAAGKALRDKLPRLQHGQRREDKNRADPIQILKKSDAGRLKELLPIRYGRMLASPFAFYRGTAAIMASDLANHPSTGHRVQSCGDCHLANFGGFATAERHIIFDMNDFDETLPAPWEWDLKRLAASFVLAGRSNGLSDAKARDCAVAAATAYREGLRDFSKLDPLEVWYARLTADELIEQMPAHIAKILRKRIEKATSASGSELDFPKLAGAIGGQTRIRDQPPLIFHPEVSAAPGFRDVLDKVFRAYRETLADDRRVLLDRYHLVDEAIKVVGVGSVGRRCWIALMMSAKNEPLFLQFKEAVASVLEPYAGKSVYPSHGQRVVVGQRLMQPASDIFLGWLTAPNGRHFYVRQLRDAKIKPLIETFDAEMLEFYAKACGSVLARAHAKAGSILPIVGYLGSSEEFDEAMGNFANAYADQAERDHARLKAAVRKGQIEVFRET